MNAKQISKLNNSLRSASIEDKTMLFVENYYHGARGVITRKFIEILSDPEYRDYTIAWVARDYDATVQNFGNLIDTHNVWICASGGRDSIKFYNTSKYIFTSSYLPDFFVKKEGQYIFFAPISYIVGKKDYSQIMLYKLLPTVNNADELIAEKSSWFFDEFAEVFSAGSKKRICEAPAVISEKKIVFISLQNRYRAMKNMVVFQYVYETIYYLAMAYGYEVHWKLHLFIYNKYKNDELSRITYRNIHCDEEDCSKYMRMADIVITDSEADAEYANYYCENTIYYCTEKARELAFPYGMEGIQLVFDYEKLLDVFEITMGGDPEEIETVDLAKVPVLFDCPDELRGELDVIKVEIEHEEEHQSVKKCMRPNILLAVETCGHEEFPQLLDGMLQKYKDSVTVNVLYRSSWEGGLLEQIDELSTNIAYTCRNGLLQGNPVLAPKLSELIDSDEYADTPEYWRQLQIILSDEWKRILGEKRYDYAISIDGRNPFWINMGCCIPADEVRLYPVDHSAEKMVGDIETLLGEIIRNDYRNSKQAIGVDEGD